MVASTAAALEESAGRAVMVVGLSSAGGCLLCLLLASVVQVCWTARRKKRKAKARVFKVAPNGMVAPLRF